MWASTARVRPELRGTCLPRGTDESRFSPTLEAQQGYAEMRG